MFSTNVCSPVHSDAYVFSLSFTRTLISETCQQRAICDHCKCVFTVKHMLLECPNTAVVRDKYFSSTTLKQLFSNVDARCILDFTKESGFYQAI